MITSNLPFQEWTEVPGSKRLTGALLDRLTRHVHILEMNGDSYRLKQSRRKRSRQPPNVETATHAHASGEKGSDTFPYPSHCKMLQGIQGRSITKVSLR
jgi:hypothetical protein